MRTPRPDPRVRSSHAEGPPARHPAADSIGLRPRYRPPSACRRPGAAGHGPDRAPQLALPGHRLRGLAEQALLADGPAPRQGRRRRELRGRVRHQATGRRGVPEPERVRGRVADAGRVRGGARPARPMELLGSPALPRAARLPRGERLLRPERERGPSSARSRGTSGRRPIAGAARCTRACRTTSSPTRRPMPSSTACAAASSSPACRTSLPSTKPSPTSSRCFPRSPSRSSFRTRSARSIATAQHEGRHRHQDAPQERADRSRRRDGSRHPGALGQRAAAVGRAQGRYRMARRPHLR